MFVRVKARRNTSQDVSKAILWGRVFTLHGLWLDGFRRGWIGWAMGSNICIFNIFVTCFRETFFFFFNLVKTSNGLLIDFHHRKAILRLVYLIGKVMAIFGNNNIFSLKILIILGIKSGPPFTVVA